MSDPSAGLIENWLLSLHPNTRKNYTLYFNEFLKHVNSSPEQLIQMAGKDLRQIHLMLKKFCDHTARQGLAYETRHVAYCAVRSFFMHNDYPLGRSPRRFKARVQYARHRLLQPREVFNLVASARTTRNRAVLSFLYQSGQRTQILNALRYGDVREQLERRVTPLVIDVNSGLMDSKGESANKGAVTYRFAIGREASDFLRQMIFQRMESGEPIDGESFLFRSNVVKVQHSNGKLFPLKVAPSYRGHSLSRCAIMWVVDMSAKNAGLQVKHVIGKYRNGVPKVMHEIHPHIFRTFWKHQMRLGGVTDRDILDYMMGHSPRFGATYDHFDEDYVRKEYARAEPHLTVMDYEFRKIDTPVQSNETIPASSVSLHSLSSQRVVTEPEIDRYLMKGWKYVATLPSGRIVVQS